MTSQFTVGDYKKIYGGKGFYLTWLSKKVRKNDSLKLYSEVPQFKIIPIQECKRFLENTHLKRETIESYFKDLPKMKYSVRSGAEKSLPGLMDTKLFVKRRNVYEEVKKVFNSFKNIPEDVRKNLDGTAAIIQCMAWVFPKNDVKVGVVFPKIIDMDTIQFVFRYKKKVGDDIVSGKSEEDGVLIFAYDFKNHKYNQNTIFFQHPIVSMFTNYLYTFWHPPEFEIIMDSTDNKTWFLQARDYKLTPKEAKQWCKFFKDNGLIKISEDIVKRAKEFTKVEVDEEPYIETEGEGYCYGRFVGTINFNTLNEPYIKYIKEGVSLNWIDVVKDKNCVGIAFSKGSLHCHGVVLAKGYRKAFIKIKEDDVIDLFGKKVTLLDGKVFLKKLKVKESKFKKEEYNLITPKLTKKYITYKFVSDLQQAKEDIIKYKLAILGGIAKKDLNQVINTVVTRFILWGVLACIGELRHLVLKYETTSCGITKEKIFKFLDFTSKDQKAGAKLCNSLVYKIDANAKIAGIYRPLIKILKTGITKRELYEVMDITASLFNNTSMGIIKALGGKEEVLKYYNKAGFSHISQEEFLDSLGYYQSGYGGPKWGKIAEATKNLIQLLGKEVGVSKVLAALNEIEALQHNNAVFFNKFISTSPIIKIYNKFNEGEESFLKWVKEVYNMQFPDDISVTNIDLCNPDELPLKKVFK